MLRRFREANKATLLSLISSLEWNQPLREQRDPSSTSTGPRSSVVRATDIPGAKAGDGAANPSEQDWLSFAPVPSDVGEKGGAAECSDALSTDSRLQDAAPTATGVIDCGAVANRTVTMRVDQPLDAGATGTVYQGVYELAPRSPGEQEEEEKGTRIPAALKVVTIPLRDLLAGPSLYDAVQLRFRMIHPNIITLYHLSASLRFLPSGEEIRHTSPQFADALAAAATAEGEASDKPAADVVVRVVLELGTRGSLHSMARRYDRLSEEQLREILRDVVDGLRYVHEECGCVHNDVKPQNILLTGEETKRSGSCHSISSRSLSRECEQVRYKLADFAASAKASPLSDVVVRLRRYPEELLAAKDARRFLGTATHMSPESCLGVDDCTASDVWSIGIMAYHLVTGRLPWNPQECAFPSMIINGFRRKYAMGALQLDPVDSTGGSRAAAVRCPLPGGSDDDRTFGPILEEFDEPDGNGYSPSLRGLIVACLRENPMERPNCRDILSHPFLRQVGQ